VGSKREKGERRKNENRDCFCRFPLFNSYRLQSCARMLTVFSYTLSILTLDHPSHGSNCLACDQILAVWFISNSHDLLLYAPPLLLAHPLCFCLSVWFFLQVWIWVRPRITNHTLCFSYLHLLFFISFLFLTILPFITIYLFYFIIEN
jgi:hypothetical protein